MQPLISVWQAFKPSIKKHRVLLAVTIIFMTGAVLLGAALPFYTRNLVNVFTKANPDVSHVWLIFQTLVWLYVGINICYRIFDVALTMFQARVMRDLTERSFAVLQTQSMHFFENSFTGSLITSAKRFGYAFDGMSDVFFYQFMKSTIMLVIMLIVLFKETPFLAMLFAIWMVVYGGLVLLAMRLQFPFFNANAEADSEVGAILADSISNHMTVKSFGQEESEARRLHEVVQKSYRLRLRAWFTSNAFFAGQGVLMASAELGLIWYLISGWQKGVVTAGDFVFFQAYMLWMIEQIWNLGPMIHRFFGHVSDAKEMADIYQLTPEVRDAPGARSLLVEDGEVEFHAITFSYMGRKAGMRHTIDKLTLTIPAGQSVGFVGRSGAGKSTIVKLLLRFYDLDSGYIRIDRQDIANVTQESLRQQIAVVPQDPQMFHSTIWHNIAFARSDATQAEVIEAAQLAYAWDFIQELPHGLNTIVGERGVKLSGGQRQRIAIARAMLADPHILILDEATSALDSATEKIIQQAIANLLQNRTSIVIAHRLSTIMQLDRIVVIHNGEIIEDGTHYELLEHKGEYADLWAHQSGGYLK